MPHNNGFYNMKQIGYFPKMECTLADGSDKWILPVLICLNRRTWEKRGTQKIAS